VRSTPCIKARFMKKGQQMHLWLYSGLLTTPTCFGRLLRPSSGCTGCAENSPDHTTADFTTYRLYF
jgi:hypothetical protein